jgi:hypothetical protein
MWSIGGVVIIGYFEVKVGLMAIKKHEHKKDIAQPTLACSLQFDGFTSHKTKAKKR